jgi:hypothetical protein
MELKNVKRGRISDYAKKFKKAQFIAGKTPWAVKCDCAFPSATQNEVNGNDAKTLIKNGCKLVAEGANMPSTPEAVEQFVKAKLMYGPGKAANAGGVATSGLEMSQNSIRLSWTRDEVDQKLHGIMCAIQPQGQLRHGRKHRRLPEGRECHGRSGSCINEHPLRWGGFKPALSKQKKHRNYSGAFLFHALALLRQSKPVYGALT